MLVFEKWSDRRKLDDYASIQGVIAVGEIDLDNHFKHEEPHRMKQHLWFLYQLNLAWKRRLPVILHIRDALRILKRHLAHKLGGVIHCFYGSKELVQQYLDLGYHIGIGVSPLQQAERVKDLQDAVSYIPRDCILVETDAPFILPYCKDMLSPKLLRRTRNTSLILLAVIKWIAELKGLAAEYVEQATVKNTIRLFSLPIQYHYD